MASQPLTTNGGRDAASPSHSHVPADAGAPTEALVSGTVGDRCVNCGAPLSSDQRYCVVCGERRGAPRFSLPATAAATAETVVSATPPREPLRSRFGSGTTLVAGVATLLLAVLVGVLIGHSAGGGTKTIAAGPTKIIRIGGGTAAPSSAGSTAGSGSAASTGSSSSSGSSGSSNSSSAGSSGAKSKGSGASGKSSSKASTKPAASKKQATQESSAASKVTGGSNAPAATVTVGQKGSGAGFNKKTHKFDGSFFGG